MSILSTKHNELQVMLFGIKQRKPNNSKCFFRKLRFIQLRYLRKLCIKQVNVVCRQDNDVSILLCQYWFSINGKIKLQSLVDYNVSLKKVEKSEMSSFYSISCTWVLLFYRRFGSASKIPSVLEGNSRQPVGMRETLQQVVECRSKHTENKTF